MQLFEYPFFFLPSDVTAAKSAGNTNYYKYHASTSHSCIIFPLDCSNKYVYKFLFSGTRNVVAECLGKLCLICPEQLLPQLQSALSSPSPLMRTTVVTAMKFTISDQPQPIDALLKNSIGDFLSALTDPDLNVRR